MADTLAAKFPKVAELMHTSKADVLAFSAFKHEPVGTGEQRDQAPSQRRGIFPNDAAMTRLIGAVQLDLLGGPSGRHRES